MHIYGLCSIKYGLLRGYAENEDSHTKARGPDLGPLSIANHQLAPRKIELVCVAPKFAKQVSN